MATRRQIAFIQRLCRERGVTPREGYQDLHPTRASDYIDELLALPRPDGSTLVDLADLADAHDGITGLDAVYVRLRDAIAYLSPERLPARDPERRQIAAEQAYWRIRDALVALGRYCDGELPGRSA